MLTLDEYVGMLVANVAQAKVLADVESAKIATLYANDDILQHFSIPRMKIEDIELNIPIAVEAVVDGADQARPAVDPDSFRELTYGIVLESLSISSLDDERAAKLNTAISQNIDILNTKAQKENNAEDLLYEYSMNMSKFVMDNWKNLLPKQSIAKVAKDNRSAIINKLIQNLQRRLQEEIHIERHPSALKKLKVTVDTHKLKEKNTSALLFLKMKLTEESLEWERVEDAEGNVITKLTPY